MRVQAIFGRGGGRRWREVGQRVPVAHAASGARPFVAPVYAWSSAVGRSGRMRLPWSMAFLFRVIGDNLDGSGRYAEMPRETVSLGEAFSADATADGADGRRRRLGMPGRRQARRGQVVLSGP